MLSVLLVLDFNDNKPIWPQDSYNCRVSWEAQPGHIITALVARDPDVGETRLVYSIHSGDPHSIFHMDHQAGKRFFILNSF